MKCLHNFSLGYIYNLIAIKLSVSRIMVKKITGNCVKHLVKYTGLIWWYCFNGCRDLWGGGDLSPPSPTPIPLSVLKDPGFYFIYVIKYLFN